MWNIDFRAVSCQGQGMELLVVLVPSLPCPWAECALMARELSGRNVDVVARIRAGTAKR